MTRRPLAFLCVICVIIIAALTAFGLPPDRGRADKNAVLKALEVPRSVSVTGEVKSSRELDDYSFFILEQAVLSVNSTHYNINNVRVTQSIPAHYAVGVRVRVSGVCRCIEAASNPGQFDRKSYYRLQGIDYTMSDPDVTVLSPGARLLPEFLAQLREALIRRVRKAYPDETAGVAAAMILGDRSYLSDEIQAAFSMGGISHVLAISGLHISLFGEGVYRLLLVFPLIGKKRKKLAGILAVVILAVYSMITGLAVATVRAFIMFALMRGADLAGRTYDPPTAAAAAAFLIILYQPYYVFYNGFILSFAAVIVFTVFHDRSVPIRGLILFLSTLPIVLFFFYEFAAYTAVINLLVVPFMPFYLVFCFVGTLFGGGFYGVFSLPAVYGLKAVLWLLGIFRRMPFSNFVLGRPAVWQILLYYSLLLLFLYLLDRWRTRKRRFALFVCIIPLISIFAIHPRSGLTLHFLDVGQGDCCVMEMPGGQNILVDGGSSSVFQVGNDRIVPFLKYEGIQKLDYIFVTHMDSDHTNGVVWLLESVRKGETALQTGKLVLPYLKERGEAYREMERLGRETCKEIIYVRSGDEFHFERSGVWGLTGGAVKPAGGVWWPAGGGFKPAVEAWKPAGGARRPARKAVNLRILGPDPDIETDPVDENGQCITFALQYGGFDCLMTGDVQNAGEEGMIRILRGVSYRAEILKVAHHGSRFSTPEELLKIVRPDIGIISCGRDNRYGHPHAELVRRLMGAGTEMLRTDECGEICVRTDGREYTCEGFLH